MYCLSNKWMFELFLFLLQFVYVYTQYMSVGSMWFSVIKNKSLLLRFTNVGSDLKVPWQSETRESKKLY